MDRVTQRLGRGVEGPVLSVVEGTSGVFNRPLLLGAFQPPGPARFFPGAENQGPASILPCPALPLHSRQPYSRALDWR